MWKGWVAVSKGKVTGLIGSKYGRFCYVFWTYDLFATKFCLMVYKPQCLVKGLLCCVHNQYHSKASKFHSIFGLYPLNYLILCGQALHGDVSSWAKGSHKEIDCYQCWDQSDGSYIQNMISWLYCQSCWSFGSQVWFDDTLS